VLALLGDLRQGDEPVDDTDGAELLGQVNRLIANRSTVVEITVE
jgi:hypothetical protein